MRPGPCGALTGREEAAVRRLRRRKLQEPRLRHHVVVHRLHAAAHEVRLVPEAGAAGIAEKTLPPVAVRLRPRPTLERIEVAPVLTHSRVRWEQRPEEILVKQEAVRLLADGVLD